MEYIYEEKEYNYAVKPLSIDGVILPSSAGNKLSTTIYCMCEWNVPAKQPCLPAVVRWVPLQHYHWQSMHSLSQTASLISLSLTMHMRHWGCILFSKLWLEVADSALDSPFDALLDFLTLTSSSSSPSWETAAKSSSKNLYTYNSWYNMQAARW